MRIVYVPSGTSLPALFLRSHVALTVWVWSWRVAPDTASASAPPAFAVQATRWLLRVAAHRPIVLTNAPVPSSTQATTTLRGA